MELNFNVRKLKDNVILPHRATAGSAGYDLCLSNYEDLVLPAHSRLTVGLGFCAELPMYTVGLIYIRSGISNKYGITLANNVGVIDWDYRGEWKITLVNNSDETYTLRPRERVAQLIITPYFTPEVNVVDTLSDTERGTGGFGSTGR